MEKVIIYSTEDGGVAVIVPAPDAGLTVEEIAAKDCPAGATFEIVSAADIPADRTFRGAWERSGREVVHSLPKCKTIAHDARRAMRSAEFAPLDVEATIPAKAAQAEAARQAIRTRYDQMQIWIDTAKDVDGIKAAMAGK